MSVIFLALMAMAFGFVLIAFMGKAPASMIQEEAHRQGAPADRIEFEDLVALERAVRALIESQGMVVTELREVGPDEFELFAQSGTGLDAGLIVFHCVLASEPIGADRVSNLLSAVRGERALKGVFVTSGYFTADVHTIVEGPPVDLINGERLAELLLDHGILIED